MSLGYFCIDLWAYWDAGCWIQEIILLCSKFSFKVFVLIIRILQVQRKYLEIMLGTSWLTEGILTLYTFGCSRKQKLIKTLQLSTLPIVSRTSCGMPFSPKMPSISPIQWQHQIFGVDSHNTEELKPWVTRASAATMTRVVAFSLPWAPWPRMGVASCNGSGGQRETVAFGLRFDRIQQYSTMFCNVL